MIIKIGNKVIGELDKQTKTFSKKVKVSKHLFRIFDAWGIDGKFFKEVLLPDNYTISIYDTEEKIKYITDAKTYDKEGQFYHFKGKIDHKPQIFLSRYHFKKQQKENK